MSRWIKRVVNGKVRTQRKVEGGVLAEGEATGHAHRIEAEVWEDSSGEHTRSFELEKSKPVTHEEHGPIMLPPNRYASAPVRELDYFRQSVRNVAD